LAVPPPDWLSAPRIPILDFIETIGSAYPKPRCGPAPAADGELEFVCGRPQFNIRAVRLGGAVRLSTVEHSVVESHSTKSARREGASASCATTTMMTKPGMCLMAIAAFLLGAALASPGGAEAAGMTVKQVSELLVTASPGHPADLSRADLGFLDLSDLDFKRANLAGANLYGADLSRADLSGADLSGADLDHAVITATNFSNANLSNARLYDIAAYSTLEPSRAEAPSFAGADLSGAQVLARLTDVDLHGANLTRARLGFARDQFKTPLRNDLSGCDLSGARLTDADLHDVRLSFAKLVDADLSGANLTGSDLAQADLTGANLAGATLTGADLDEAVLRRVRGLDQARGLDLARNRDKAIY